MELEERITSLEDNNKELLLESEKLKSLVNDLLHLSKVQVCYVLEVMQPFSRQGCI